MTDFNAFGSIPTQPVEGASTGDQAQQPSFSGQDNPFSRVPTFSTSPGSLEQATPAAGTQQFADIIPESPTLSGNATEQMMHPQQTSQQQVPQQAPLSQSTGADETPAEAPAYFTPEQPVQNTPEPLREYAEPSGGISGKTLFSMSFFCLILGVFIGIFFLGTSTPAPQSTGLQGVVKNPDITTPLKRCGQVEKGQACIFYIFNNTRYDRTVDSFFDEIVRLTEISKYSIAMVNAQYAKTLIRPGYIAEIKLPAQH